MPPHHTHTWHPDALTLLPDPEASSPPLWRWLLLVALIVGGTASWGWLVVGLVRLWVRPCP